MARSWLKSFSQSPESPCPEPHLLGWLAGPLRFNVSAAAAADKTFPSAIPSAPLERHYSPEELGQIWNLSADTVRRLFEREPGVLVIERNRSRARRYRTLRIPPYRRHKTNCPHRAKGRTHRRCACPIWVDGVLTALRFANHCGCIDGKKPSTMLSHAWDEFERDARSRQLREPTLNKYKYLRVDMERFAARKGLRFVAEFTLEMLRKWRSSWPNKNRAH